MPGCRRAVVVHADLPFADDLRGFADLEPDVVAMVPDRHGDGTNVLSVPTGAGFAFAYGAGSFGRHRAEAERLGLTTVVIDAVHLGWDVDEPADLHPPEHLGRLPLSGLIQ